MLRRTVIAVAASSLTLSGCGGGEASPTSTGVAVAPAPTPTPTPTPTPSPTPPPTQTQGAGAHQFASDFDDGTAYPAAATVDLASFDVPAGSTQVHVPVTLNRPTANTIVSFIRVYNGDGGRAAPDTVKTLIFRSGDPLTKTVTFDVRNMSEGNTVKVTQANVPDGGKRGVNSATITAKAGSSNAPVTGGRAALAFKPYGTEVYSETGATIAFDDQGGPQTFSTSLVHGRTQYYNSETGYYGPIDMGGFERNGGNVVLKTFRPAAPIRMGSPIVEYPFVASVLSGHKTTATHFKYGTVEWQVRLPNRRGTWPAMWLLPTAGWPPEIDVYEGFGFNDGWKFDSDLSTNLHGGKNGGSRTFTRPALHMTTQDFGIAPTLDSEFHTFAVTVTPDWITIFLDGRETMQYANPFAGQTWYPLTQLATKAKIDDPYTEGKGTLELRSLRVWRAE